MRILPNVNRKWDTSAKNIRRWILPITLNSVNLSRTYQEVNSPIKSELGITLIVYRSTLKRRNRLKFGPVRVKIVIGEHLKGWRVVANLLRKCKIDTSIYVWPSVAFGRGIYNSGWLYSYLWIGTLLAFKGLLGLKCVQCPKANSRLFLAWVEERASLGV